MNIRLFGDEEAFRIMNVHDYHRRLCGRNDPFSPQNKLLLPEIGGLNLICRHLPTNHTPTAVRDRLDSRVE